MSAADKDIGHRDNWPDSKQPIIEKRDIPAGTTLTTRHGMKLAYGTLWMTWTDRTEKEGVAASMAREILRAELSQEECGEGISLVRSLRKREKGLFSGSSQETVRNLSA